MSSACRRVLSSVQAARMVPQPGRLTNKPVFVPVAEAGKSKIKVLPRQLCSRCVLTRWRDPALQAPLVGEHESCSRGRHPHGPQKGCVSTRSHAGAQASKLEFVGSVQAVLLHSKADFPFFSFLTFYVPWTSLAVR